MPGSATERTANDTQLKHQAYPSKATNVPGPESCSKHKPRQINKDDKNTKKNLILYNIYRTKLLQCPTELQQHNTELTMFHWILGIMGSAIATDLTAYDCSIRNGANFSQISLLDVAECRNVSASYEEGDEIRVQIIQKLKEQQIETTNCQLRITMHTAYCSSNIVYTRVWNAIQSLTNEPVEITKKQCTDAFFTKNLIFDDDGRYGSKKPTISVKLRDDLTGDGVLTLRGNESLTKSSCTPESFPFMRQTFSSHILRLTYHAVVQKKKAILSFKHGKLLLAENLATTQLQKGELYDTKHGAFFWPPINPHNSKCNEYVEIVEAPGRIYTPINYTNTYPIALIEPRGTSAPFGFSTSTRNIAITLQSKVSVCGRLAFSTHIKEVFVVVIEDRTPILHLQKASGSDVDQLVNLKAILGSTYLSSELRVSASFNSVANILCQQSREHMLTDLATYGGRNIDGKSETRLKGKLIMKGGSIIYILNCRQVTVTLRKNVTQCHEDVPITYQNNKTGALENIFMDPVTYNIRPESRLTMCSHVIPAKFGIMKTNGELTWVCFTPQIQSGGRCTPPMELNPLHIDPFYTPNVNAIDTDLYNKEQLDSIDKKQWELTHEGSVLTEFVLLAGGGPNANTKNAHNPSSSLFSNIIENTKYKIRDILFPGFFGLFIFVFENIYTLVIINYILNLILGFIGLIARIRKMLLKMGGMTWQIILTLTTGLFLVAVPLNTTCPCQEENFGENMKKEILMEIRETERNAFIKRVFN